MNTLAKAAEISAVGFSLQSELNPKRTLVAQTHIASDASAQDMYAMLNKLCKVADTLDTRYRLVDMRLLLQKSREELPMHEKKLEDFETTTYREHNRSGRRKDFDWSGQAKVNRDNLVMTVARCRLDIERIEKGIAEAEAEIAEMTLGASGTADHQSGASDR
jgi:L-rhamnose isomerase